MMEYNSSCLILMTAIISFIGFTIENTWMLLKHGYIDNRNMTFPFLLGYGMLVVGMFILFGVPGDIRLLGMRFLEGETQMQYVVYFLISFTVVSLGETALGFFVEKVFGFEYWNYTDIPLHITKYTSVPTSTGFALLITSFMGSCFEPLLRFTQRVPPPLLNILAVTLGTAMVADFIASFTKMYRTRSLNQKWRKEFPLKKKYRK